MRAKNHENAARTLTAACVWPSDHGSANEMRDMSQTAVGGVGAALREFFLLERAERDNAELTVSQRECVRTYYDAALRRLSVADGIRGPGQTAVALSLYREAWLYLSSAVLASRDATADVRSLAPEQAWERLESALATGGIVAPPELEAAKPVLIAPDPLAIDRLGAEEASQAAEGLEISLRWLSRLVDARLPRALKVTRVARIAAAVTSAVVLLVSIAVWVSAPSNVALHKATRSSAPAYNTAPEGAVDGEKNGSFGFHSVEEESPWLTINLGRPHTIARVKVFGRGDGYNDQSIPLALEVSDDGASFRKLAERTEPFSEAEPWVVEVTSVVARFVRLRTERHSVLVLSEVEVYGRKR